VVSLGFFLTVQSVYAIVSDPYLLPPLDLWLVLRPQTSPPAGFRGAEETIHPTPPEISLMTRATTHTHTHTHHSHRTTHLSRVQHWPTHINENNTTEWNSTFRFGAVA